MKRLSVLVTGFGPFPGVRVNPSAELARRLARSGRFQRMGLDIKAAVLDTRYDDMRNRLPSLVAAADVVLMIGVAGRARWLRVEERGVAHASRTAPDAGGRSPGTPVPRAAHVLKTPLPVSACVAALARARLPARRSNDAGRYLCNAGYYEALLRAGRKTFVLFVHVPLAAAPAGTLPRSRRRWARPRLDAMERGLAAIVLGLVRTARQRTIPKTVRGFRARSCAQNKG